MTRTGAVPPTAVRELDSVSIRTVAVGPMDNDAYLVTCRSSGAQVLIDAAAAGADDADAIEAATGTVIHRRLHDGDLVEVGHVTLTVIALRGHTPGSIALAYREPAHVHVEGASAGRMHLFTGDSLFPGGVGATRGVPALFTQLLDDVTARVFDLFGDDTWVYPGHGRGTTLGAERPHLREWRARGW